MKHLHRRVIEAGVVAAVLVGVAYALLGIGFAVMVAIGLFAVGALVLAAVVVFEEETHEPAWQRAHEAPHDHGYHPAR